MTDEPGVPLSHLRQHRAGVLVICNGCQDWRSVEIAKVVARLDAEGVGAGEKTGVRDVASFLRAPCRKCGAVNWETRPDYSRFAGIKLSGAG
jgi:hypothetical protein